jgi:hypothetical protein
MRRGRVIAGAAGLLALALVPGCGASKASDAKVRETLLRGVAEIRGSQNTEKLYGRLVQTRAELRSQHPSTAAGRASRRLAIEGFTWTLKGVRASLDITTNDSGNLEGSVRDAKRSDRYLNRAANLLRAAGQTFGLPIGKLNGR